MEDKTRQKKKIKVKAIVCAAFVLLLILFMVLRNIPLARETMQRRVSRNIILIMGNLTGRIPFSLYEALLYVGGTFIVFSIVYSIVLLFKKKRLWALNTFVRLLMVGIIIATTYFASAGFSYAKEGGYVPLYGEAITDAELILMTDYFIDDFNFLAESLERDKDGNVISPYSDSQLANKLIEEYKRIEHPELNKYTPKCKTILSSRIMSEMHIAGVFFAPFGEANINKAMPDAEKPHTMAHELAHAKGIMREDEADLMASYVTLTSEDGFIRYSGYLMTYYYLIDAFYTRGDYEGYYKYNDMQSPKIMKEYSNINQFWRQFDLFDSIMKNITSFINDIYLRLMGQEEGTDAYIPPTKTEPVPNIDPDTGDVIIDPDTGTPEIIYVPYNDLQKLYFSIFKEKQG